MLGDELPERVSVAEETALASGGTLCYLPSVRTHLLPAALLLSATATLAPAAAFAHGGGAAMPTEVPQAPPGPGADAQAIVKDLEGQGLTDPEAARVTADPIKAVKVALERAHGARAAGDELHGRMLEGLALEWAETARDLARAAVAEQAAQAIGKKAYEVQTQAERARALLEETQARRGRAAAELAHVEAEARDAFKGAADTEAQRIEAARKKQKKAGAPAEKAPAPPTPRPTAPQKKGAK